MTERALSFGAAAASYERYRPGYPPSLIDAVLAYAGRPVRTALEIGAGTGKATREFAARVSPTRPPSRTRPCSGHLSTISAYLVVPVADSPALFDAVRAVLLEQVDLDADLELHLARRI